MSWRTNLAVKSSFSPKLCHPSVNEVVKSSVAPSLTFPTTLRILESVLFVSKIVPVFNTN